MSRPLKVAVVEDEYITASFVAEVLQELGCEVLFCSDNGEDALKKVIELKPQLLFLDINLEGRVDGISLAKKINNLKQNIEHIYITAYNNKETLKDASLTKPLDYLSKPFTCKDIEIALSLAEAKISDASLTTEESSTLEISKDLCFNFEYKTLYDKNRAVKLSARELEVINLLCKRANRVVSQKEIALTVWQKHADDTSALRDIIYRIRKKVPLIDIESVSTLGYRLSTI